MHCATAHADAVAIKLGGVKSYGENHQEAVDILNELVAESEEKKSALNTFSRIIAHKTSVSYSGEAYERKDVDQLWKLLIRFQKWAAGILC